MDGTIQAYRQSVQFTTPVSVNIFSKEDGKILSIASCWSQHNIERKSKMTSEMFQTLNTETEEVITYGCCDISGNLLTSYSPSGLLKAVVREVPAADKNPKKQFIEVWKDNLMFNQFDLNSLDLHGDIYLDSEFKTFEWSLDDKILYVAEKKKPKSESFLNSKSKKSEEGEGDKVSKGDEYLFTQDWGEQLVGKCHSVIVVVDLSNNKVSLLEVNEAKDYFYGSATWAPGGGVIAVAYDIEPRRLGKVYCTNRPSYIVHIAPDGKLTKLSAEDKSVFGPKVSPDQKRVIWFEREVGGPHHSCVSLIKYDWISNKTTTVVDFVPEEIKCSGGQPFYGLYNSTKPPNCWLSDNRTIVLSTQQRLSVKTYAIDTDLGTITEISQAVDEEYSQGVLKVWNNYVLCWRSSLDNFPGLYLAKLEPGSISKVNWIPLIPCKEIEENYGVHIIRLKGETWNDPTVKVQNYSAIYFGPKSGEKVPLIVWSHGGPQSNFNNAFDVITHFFSKIKFSVLMVNYRGSIGAGRNSIRHLLGKIGKSDVSDMFQAYQYTLQNFPIIDNNKCVLFGGSHGGFLSLHLAGQYPDNFKSCVVRNPVADLTQMGSSDIPDWLFTENGLIYSPHARFSKEEYEILWKASPQYFVNQVKMPVLLLIGSKDLRVPQHQGINYYYMLKEHGKAKTKLLLYDDNHPLAKSVTDFLINTALWFMDSY